MYSRSLSIVFGMPMTLILRPRELISSTIACAPRSVPSPPMTKSTLIRFSTRKSTISFGGCGPRELPKIERTVLVDVADQLRREVDQRVAVLSG